MRESTAKSVNNCKMFEFCAIDAFLAIAEADLAAGRWKSAADVYAEAAEIWPKAAKRSSVHDGRGWALMKLGRLEEALTAFTRAEELAKDLLGWEPKIPLQEGLAKTIDYFRSR